MARNATRSQSPGLQQERGGSSKGSPGKDEAEEQASQLPHSAISTRGQILIALIARNKPIPFRLAFTVENTSGADEQLPLSGKGMEAHVPMGPRALLRSGDGEMIQVAKKINNK